MSRIPPVQNKQTVWRSFPLQILAGLAAAAGVPSLLFIDFLAEPGVAAQGLYVSIIAASFASVLGTTLQRRVTAFPGARELSYILPSYMSSYAIALSAIVISRLNYNRPFLVLSVALSLATAFILVFYIRRHSRRRFHVVPFGEVDVVTNSPEADWVFMEHPAPPADINATIVADLKYDHAPEWERMLAEAAIRGNVVYHTKQLCESLTGQVSIAHLSENSFGSLVPNLAYVKSKRLIDLVSALLLMPVFAPIFAVVAILIKIDSPGPVFFRQQRMGYRGRHFSMVKFRTMRPRPLQGDGCIDDAMTTDNDSRITKIGRFLRRTRIDELPQILNIIRGEMSWIGPRPEATVLSEWYDREIPFYVYRHIVRPGITGWAQVNQGHVTDINAVTEKLAYDFYYIKYFSFWLDILISLRMARTIMNGFGAK